MALRKPWRNSQRKDGKLHMEEVIADECYKWLKSLNKDNWIMGPQDSLLTFGLIQTNLKAFHEWSNITDIHTRDGRKIVINSGIFLVRQTNFDKAISYFPFLAKLCKIFIFPCNPDAEYLTVFRTWLNIFLKFTNNQEAIKLISFSFDESDG